MEPSLHKKINKVNRFIFGIGSLFVVICIGVMFYLRTLPEQYKKQINLSIKANFTIKEPIPLHLMLNDSIQIFSLHYDAGATNSLSKTISIKNGKNCVSITDSLINGNKRCCLDFDNAMAINIFISLSECSDSICATIDCFAIHDN